MEDNPNKTKLALPCRPYKPVDDGWNSPVDDDTGGRQIQGTLLRYDDKQWFAGKEKTVIPNGSRYIALDIKTGWKRWENGKVVDFVTEVDGHYPKRHELGYTDESKWECGPDDKPTDPLQNSRRCCSSIRTRARHTPSARPRPVDAARWTISRTPSATPAACAPASCRWCRSNGR